MAQGADDGSLEVHGYVRGRLQLPAGGRIALRHAVSLHRPEHREEGAAEHPHKRRGVHIYVHLV